MARGHKKGFQPQFCCLLTAPRATWELSRTTGCYRCCNIIECVRNFTGRVSSVSIATRYGLDGPGIGSRWGVRFSATFQNGPEAQPASYIMGTGTFPGVKRPGRGVDHPPPSSAEVKERAELYLYSPSGPAWPVLV